MIDGSLERTRPLFRELAEKAGLLDAEVSVRVKPLTPEEAIGSPDRRDFPILIGKERVIEAEVAGNRGHAFTDTARNFTGRLSDVLEMPLDENGRRAVYVATLNAALHHLHHVEGTIHCRDDDPEICGKEISRTLRQRFGNPRVGLIGFNPAIAEYLIRSFTSDRVWIADLNPDNIGQTNQGVQIWDGAKRLVELIAASDVILVTGTTLVNGTFDQIWKKIAHYKKTGLVYGVTAAAVCALLGYERICPRARNG